MITTRAVVVLMALVAWCGVARGKPVAIRVATFNVEDLRTDDLKNPDQPRVKTIVETIQRMRPNIIFINEIAYDEPGSPGYVEGEERGLNGQRLADLVSKPGVLAVRPIRYRAFMARSNTGIHSGFDLNRDGVLVEQVPAVASREGGRVGRGADEGRGCDYGNDCWGSGRSSGSTGWRCWWMSGWRF
ncbi:MAG: hypothetical protein R3B49_11785 [Phycisphaerales bacterium]